MPSFFSVLEHCFCYILNGKFIGIKNVISLSSETNNPKFIFKGVYSWHVLFLFFLNFFLFMFILLEQKGKIFLLLDHSPDAASSLGWARCHQDTKTQSEPHLLLALAL